MSLKGQSFTLKCLITVRSNVCVCLAVTNTYVLVNVKKQREKLHFHIGRQIKEIAQLSHYSKKEETNVYKDKY